MSRRGRGEGTVLRDGDGWIARIDLPIGADGKRRRRKRRARTKQAAFAALQELRKEAESLENPEGLMRSLSVAVDDFLKVQSALDRAQGTVDAERWRADVVMRGLGRKPIGRLAVNDVDRFLELASQGEYGSRKLATETLRRIRSLLVKVLKNEMRMGNLVKNVADLSVMPSQQARRHATGTGDSSLSSRRSLSKEEFGTLWRSARYPLAVVVDLSGRNGLRPSEARAVRWACVDFEARTLTIDRQMTADTTLTSPKTRRSLRTIPIDSSTIECLSSWRAQQDRKRQNAGDRWTDQDLVVTTRYGTGVNSANLRRMVGSASEQAGLGNVKPYELRHTAITLQIDAGHPSWQVADWAGTSVRMIEDTYRHRLHRVAVIGPVDLPELVSKAPGVTAD